MDISLDVPSLIQFLNHSFPIYFKTPHGRQRDPLLFIIMWKREADNRSYPAPPILNDLTKLRSDNMTTHSCFSMGLKLQCKETAASLPCLGVTAIDEEYPYGDQKEKKPAS